MENKADRRRGTRTRKQLIKRGADTAEPEAPHPSTVTNAIEAAKLPILSCGAPVHSPNIGVRCSSKHLKDTQNYENYLNKVSVYSAFFILYMAHPVM